MYCLVLEVRELQKDIFQRGLGDAKVDNLQLLLHGEDGSEDVRKRRPACTCRAFKKRERKDKTY